jgi:hypothetical protein
MTMFPDGLCLLLLLTLGGGGPILATPPRRAGKPPAPWVVLDYRSVHPAPWRTAPGLVSLGRETNPALFRLVLGDEDAHLAKEPGYHPTIVQILQGHFLDAQHEDTLYLVMGTRPEMFSSLSQQQDGRILVLRDTRRVVDRFVYANGIAAPLELGPAERRLGLFLELSTAWMGEIRTSLKLIRLGPGGCVVLKDFGTVAAELQEPIGEARIQVAATVALAGGDGRSPRPFRVEYYDLLHQGRPRKLAPAEVEAVSEGQITPWDDARPPSQDVD